MYDLDFKKPATGCIIFPGIFFSTGERVILATDIPCCPVTAKISLK